MVEHVDHIVLGQLGKIRSQLESLNRRLGELQSIILDCEDRQIIDRRAQHRHEARLADLETQLERVYARLEMADG